MAFEDKNTLLQKYKDSLSYWKKRYKTAYYNFDKEECMLQIQRLEKLIQKNDNNKSSI